MADDSIAFLPIQSFPFDTSPLYGCGVTWVRNGAPWLVRADVTVPITGPERPRIKFLMSPGTVGDKPTPEIVGLLAKLEWQPV